VDEQVTLIAVVVPLAVLTMAVRALARCSGLRRAARSRRAWLVVAPATVAVLALGVPWAYVEWGQDEAPAPLAFERVDTDERSEPPRRSTTTTTNPFSVEALFPPALPFVPPASGTVVPFGAGSSTTAGPTTSSSMAPGEADGTWTVGRGSKAGYRAEEVFVAQQTTVAGRTDRITGQLSILDSVVHTATFVVQLRSVESDNPQRDEQFRKALDTATHPTATLELSEPIAIGPVPPEGEVIARTVSGRFTIRGVTRTVTFDLEARRVQGRIEVLGSVPVTWSDFGVPDPSNGLVNIKDRGTIEFLLYLDRA
jgi:polyisoprenoid-binding protein YceI